MSLSEKAEKSKFDLRKFAHYVLEDPVVSKNHLFTIDLITLSFLTFWIPPSEDPDYLRAVSDVQVSRTFLFLLLLNRSDLSSDLSSKMDVLNWIRMIVSTLSQKEVFFLLNKLFLRLPLQEYFPSPAQDQEVIFLSLSISLLNSLLISQTGCPHKPHS